MRVPCPWCGARELGEFAYGGEAARRRPDSDAPLGEWTDYVYLRDNRRGAHWELWHHGAGCRRWFRLRRDTATHEILASAPPAAPREKP